jgi:hypothetical protein
MGAYDRVSSREGVAYFRRDGKLKRCGGGEGEVVSFRGERYQAAGFVISPARIS